MQKKVLKKEICLLTKTILNEKKLFFTYLGLYKMVLVSFI